MQLDPNEMQLRDIYTTMVGLITPRPIAWVSSMSRGGVANLAPYSFFNGVGANPPTIMFCPANQRDGSPKDTLANIQQTKEFVVNVVTEPDADAMNLTAANFTPDEDEFVMAGIQKADSIKIAAPRVANAAAAFECQLHSALEIGAGPAGANLVIGEIVCIYVRDDLINSAGDIVTDRLHTIGRMGGTQYARTRDRFDIARPKRPN